MINRDLTSQSDRELYKMLQKQSHTEKRRSLSRLNLYGARLTVLKNCCFMDGTGN